jgi:N6-adenosine-specific RNA methylase IME4
MELHVNSEYEALLPKLSTVEYEALKESIKTEGQHFPLVINEEQTILDGHNRYKICLELGLEPKVEVKTFPSKLLEKKFVIEVNLRRRHLNNFQKAELGFPLLAIETELARQREHKEVDVASIDATSKGKATTQVAKKIGLSQATFERAKKIIEKGSEELKEKLRKGQVSINAASIQLNRAEKHQETPVLPDGEFDVIYADPPWQYDFCLEGDPEQHYQVMPTNEICELKVPVAEDAILFLWATNPKLEDALKVIRAWGFTYKTNLVWVKDRKGPGYYFQSKHELLLIAKRGNIPPPTGDNRPPSVLEAKQTNHSQKPSEIYTIIESMYPNRQKLELFSRQKREGWHSWGLET